MRTLAVANLYIDRTCVFWQSPRHGRRNRCRLTDSTNTLIRDLVRGLGCTNLTFISCDVNGRLGANDACLS